MRELFQDFYETSNGQRPSQIIIFRDGVSETQFNQVLTKELDQIIKAYHYLGEVKIPKFTVIVAQKKHRTKFFQAGSSDNVPPGTVVDTKVVHPTNYDFYMSPHAGMMGTSRPAHYHVLLNEIGFSPDELQNLIHSLSCYQWMCGVPLHFGSLSSRSKGGYIRSSVGYHCTLDPFAVALKMGTFVRVCRVPLHYGSLSSDSKGGYFCTSVCVWGNSALGP